MNSTCYSVKNFKLILFETHYYSLFNEECIKETYMIKHVLDEIKQEYELIFINEE